MRVRKCVTNETDKSVFCRYHVYVAVFIYPSAFFAMLFRISSYALVVTAPATSNQTDPFPLVTDYLVDGEKYYLPIIIHQTFAFFFVATIYVATETLFIMWLQHSMALFELGSYYIEKGISEGPFYKEVSKEVMEVYRKKCLATSVGYHNEAKMLVFVESSPISNEKPVLTFIGGFQSFAMNLKDSFSFSYSVLLVFAVISLSINFFRVSRSTAASIVTIIVVHFSKYVHLTAIFCRLRDSQCGRGVAGLVVFHFRVSVHVLSQLCGATASGLCGGIRYDRVKIINCISDIGSLNTKTPISFVLQILYSVVPNVSCHSEKSTAHLVKVQRADRIRLLWFL
ncbi:uncharacterized protein LOC143212912 [Lasioglossum baleicum]|uniref:uncharacterized protein LOC143212912 n=1 Tax=Lasioglossum baleicum TaxID=434251 RepID=UPI003FCCFC48